MEQHHGDEDRISNKRDELDDGVMVQGLNRFRDLFDRVVCVNGNYIHGIMEGVNKL